MERKNSIIFLIFGALLVLCESRLPDFITEKCDTKDILGGTTCLTKLARRYLDPFTDGVPDLDIPKLDPYRFKDMRIDALGLNISFKDVDLLGLKKSKIQDFKIDLVNRKVRADIDFDIDIVGPYKIHGKVFVLKVNASGDSKINVQGKFKINLDYAPVKGKWRITHRVVDYNFTGANFRFENLFGESFLTNACMAILNFLWQDTMEEIAPPAVTQIVDAMIYAINKFFENTTPEELFKRSKGFQF